MITLFFLAFYIIILIFEKFKFSEFNFILFYSPLYSSNQSQFKQHLDSITGSVFIAIIATYFFIIDYFPNEYFFIIDIIYYSAFFLFIFSLYKILKLLLMNRSLNKIDMSDEINKLQQTILKSLYSFSLKTRIIKYKSGYFNIQLINHKINGIEILMVELNPSYKFGKMNTSTLDKFDIKHIINLYFSTKQADKYIVFNCVFVVDHINKKLFSLDDVDMRMINIDDLNNLTSEHLSLLEIMKI